MEGICVGLGVEGEEVGVVVGVGKKMEEIRGVIGEEIE